MQSKRPGISIFYPKSSSPDGKTFPKRRPGTFIFNRDKRIERLNIFLKNTDCSSQVGVRLSYFGAVLVQFVSSVKHQVIHHLGSFFLPAWYQVTVNIDGDAWLCISQSF